MERSASRSVLVATRNVVGAEGSGPLPHWLFGLRSGQVILAGRAGTYVSMVLSVVRRVFIPRLSQSPVMDSMLFSRRLLAAALLPVFGACSDGPSAPRPVTVTPVFLRAENGVTIVCPDAAVGDSGSVGGVVYRKRTRAQLDFLLGAGDAAALSTSCTSGVTDMSGMFRGNATFNEDISTWDVGEVTSMRMMFDNASAFNASVAAWDVSKVTDMAYMFYRAPAFNKPIGAWKVGQVTQMLQMFDGATAFDQDVSGWDVRAVTNMDFMFFGAAAFNRDLSGWCVSQFPSIPTYFDVYASAWVLPKPVWGSCPTGR